MIHGSSTCFISGYYRNHISGFGPFCSLVIHSKNRETTALQILSRHQNDSKGAKPRYMTNKQLSISLFFNLNLVET
jgi:hypothetical protein